MDSTWAPPHSLLSCEGALLGWFLMYMFLCYECEDTFPNYTYATTLIYYDDICPETSEPCSNPSSKKPASISLPSEALNAVSQFVEDGYPRVHTSIYIYIYTVDRYLCTYWGSKCNKHILVREAHIYIYVRVCIQICIYRSCVWRAAYTKAYT